MSVVGSSGTFSAMISDTTIASADMPSIVMREPSCWMISAPMIAPTTPPRFRTSQRAVAERRREAEAAQSRTASSWKPM